MSLFREEVAAAQAAQWLGAVRLQRPLSFTLMTTAAMGLALALVAFAAWGEVNRKARLSGLLVPSLGSLNITAQQERRKVWEWVLDPALADMQQLTVLNASPNLERAGG